ncbi:restriction endonuclease subunit S [Faecalibaculum rodentium]|uniref:restriction endonuclease subunit S n=1 Tax=Faecalibaculum rodentium TaxID=1702221 RepID=UPI0023F37A3C|nr:restriction endonuclease subunit S [Faecalibaculum rodentium]
MKTVNYKTKNYFNVRSGLPLQRFQHLTDCPMKPVYTQELFAADLIGEQAGKESQPMISFPEDAWTIQAGDVVYSQSSLTASPVSEGSGGCVISQNYLVLRPGSVLDPGYLVYLLNEGSGIRKQLASRLQGNQLQRVTVKDLESLQLPPLPKMEVQKAIGEVYLWQKRLTFLREKSIQNREKLVMASLKGIGNEQ